MSKAEGGEEEVSKVDSRKLGCVLDRIPNNELELLAIRLLIAQFKDKSLDKEGRRRHTALAIFRNIQITLKRGQKPLTPTTIQYLFNSIKTFFLELNDTPIRLYWTPWQENIEINEAAYEKAEQAVSMQEKQQKL